MKDKKIKVITAQRVLQKRFNNIIFNLIIIRDVA